MSLLEACRAAKIDNARSKSAAPWNDGYEAAVLKAAADYASQDASVPEPVRSIVAGYLIAAIGGGA